MSFAKDIFIKYAQVETQSDHESVTYPSTPSQLVCARMLVDECRNMGLSDVELCEGGVVMATLPANTESSAPVIGFIAHMDTSPDCSGTNVSPQIHANYDGKSIELANGITISPEEFPDLLKNIGKEIITADGTTLLGADDKAGIAAILGAMHHLLANPDIKHGKIRIAFTPDEEIGKGVDNFDVEHFGADFAYTMDGGTLGELEIASFNAARAKISIDGKSVHPGSAKGVMQNAALIAAEMAAKFPVDETPATTDGEQGFYHLTRIGGSVESANLEYILRDFDRDKFNARKDFVIDLVNQTNTAYGRELVTLNLYDEYYNMYEILKDNPQALELAKQAFANLDIEPIITPIRGGTDGSRLSYMGLPCPNIFTGGHNFHGPYEYLCVEDMELASQVIVEIIKLANI